MVRFPGRLTYSNVMATIAVFVALGGGAYAAISSIPGPDGVIHGCYSKKNGVLRLVAAGKRCSRRELAIAFNQTGRAGLRGSRGSTGSRGATGATGATGGKGEQGTQGPAGPGATSVSRKVEAAHAMTLTTLGNGLTVSATCTAGSKPVVAVETTNHSDPLQASGTSSKDGTLKAVDEPGEGFRVSLEGAESADLDVVARDSEFATFAHIDVHGAPGLGSCTFWGVFIPAS
jgi:hypothetical protein